MYLRLAIRLFLGFAGLWAIGSNLAAGPTNSVLYSPRTAVGFGSSLAGGDFNGDGFADLLIADVDLAAAVSKGSALRLHFGSAEGIVQQPAMVLPNLGLDLLHRLSTSPGATDFDGDGCADVALSSRRWTLPDGSILTNNSAVILSGRALSTGQVQTLWLGTFRTLDLATIPTIDPAVVRLGGNPAPGGRVVAFAVGDLDHDGLAEFVFALPNAPDNCELYVVWGRRSGTAEARITTLRGQPWLGFGASVAPWPDQDGDGVDDLVIGTPSRSQPVVARGGVEFWALGADRTARRSSHVLEPPMRAVRSPDDNRHQLFGYSMILLQRPGHPQATSLLVSAPYAEEGGDVDEGLVRVYRPGKPGQSPEPRFHLQGDRAYGGFGEIMAATGDVNGDGWPDALIAAPEAEHGQVTEGLVFLFPGSPAGLESRPAWAFQGEASKVRFGTALAALGDVNRDGYADFAVTSPNYLGPDETKGLVQVFYGAPDWPRLFEPIRFGKPWSRSLADWWLSRWWWEQALLGLGAVVASAALGAWGYAQWRRRTVIIVERRANEARRAERERVARDIHDEVGARLSRLHLLVEQLRRAPDTALVRTQSDQLTTSARDLRSALEQVVSGLSTAPDTLDAFAELISRQTDHLLNGTGVRCLQDIPTDVPDLPVPQAVAAELVPCVREALSNVLRHAQATEVWVRLRWEEPHLTLEIEDNGRGFAEKEIRPGHGLANLRARARAFGGRCEIDSAPGEGCRVRLSVAVPAPTPALDLNRPNPQELG